MTIVRCRPRCRTRSCSVLDARCYNFFAIALLANLLVLPLAGAAAPCKDPNENYTISEGAWNMLGVNETYDPVRLDANNINTQDPTWTIPDGTWSYPQGEKALRGNNFLRMFTCGILTFCNPEEPINCAGNEGIDPIAGAQRDGNQSVVGACSQQEVWKMKNQEAFDTCNFKDAISIGTTNSSHCVTIPFDHTSFIDQKNYYASKEHCELGQKVATTVVDWEETADQCAAVAFHLPGGMDIRNCNCDFSKVPFPMDYPPLCGHAFQEACNSVLQPGPECCEAGTCKSKLETFDNDMGIEYELARREACDDSVPGNCYNANGVASDRSGDGSTDCCTQTCSTCGSELGEGAIWFPCTSFLGKNMTANCGQLSRYSLQDFVCDFKKCPNTSHWGSENDAIYEYMGLPKPSESESLAMDGSRASATRIWTSFLVVSASLVVLS